MENTLIYPAGYSLLTADEMEYTDGGASIWDNWDGATVVNTIVTLVGNAAISAVAGIVVNAIYHGNNVADALAKALSGGGVAKKLGLTVLGAAAAYSATTKLIGNFIELRTMYNQMFREPLEQLIPLLEEQEMAAVA